MDLSSWPLKRSLMSKALAKFTESNSAEMIAAFLILILSLLMPVSLFFHYVFSSGVDYDCI